MNEKIKNWVIVAPEVPEWMRKVAKTLAEEGEDAHGAILAICYDDSQKQLAQQVNAKDIVEAISNLANLLRKQLGKALAEAWIQLAIREDKEAEA